MFSNVDRRDPGGPAPVPSLIVGLCLLLAIVVLVRLL